MIVGQPLLAKSQPMLQFKNDLKSGRLSAAYLVSTEDETARNGLLTLMALAVLCKNGGCGECPTCRAALSGNHLNLRRLPSEKVSVADVREIIADSALHSMVEGSKVYVIPAFEVLQQVAQNLLLKTLEDAPEKVVFLLGVGKEASVLSTIKSRCTTLRLPPFSVAELAEYLEEEYGDSERALIAASCSGGQLGDALRILQDRQYDLSVDEAISFLGELQQSKQIPLFFASPLFAKGNFTATLDLLITLLRDVMLINCDGQDNALFFYHKADALRALAPQFTRNAVPNLIDTLLTAKEKLQFNCNDQAVADSLMLTILEVKYKCR